MPVKTEIQDGLGSSRTVGVVPSNALLVSVLPQSSRGIPARDFASLRQLREFFTDPSGSEDQIVDGSTTPVEFSVDAAISVTKWVTGFRLIVQGDRCNLGTNEFRRYAQTVGGLANGVDIEAIQAGVTTSITGAGAVQRMGQYLRYADDFLNIIAAISSSVDYLHFDFTFDQPIVLTEGSTDRLLIRVNDDLTAALSAVSSAQFAIARGYQETI